MLTVRGRRDARCAAAIRPVDTATADTDVRVVAGARQTYTTRDLFNGPWDTAHAPDPRAEYTFVRPKTGGFNPGVIVRDPQGREWHVKQPSGQPRRRGASRGRAVARPLRARLSPAARLLPAVIHDARQIRCAYRARVAASASTLPSLKDQGEWSWQQNPFVGQRPYQGLLVILLLFNSSDLKNSNNTLYEYTPPSAEPRVAVVRRS